MDFDLIKATSLSLLSPANLTSFHWQTEVSELNLCTLPFLWGNCTNGYDWIWSLFRLICMCMCACGVPTSIVVSTVTVSSLSSHQLMCHLRMLFFTSSSLHLISLFFQKIQCALMSYRHVSWCVEHVHNSSIPYWWGTDSYIVWCYMHIYKLKEGWNFCQLL